MTTVPGAIRIRQLIPDHAAIHTGRAMLMRRLERRSRHATGLPSASGMVMRGAFVTRASAVNKRQEMPAKRQAEMLQSHTLTFNNRNVQIDWGAPVVARYAKSDV